jgi:hypothetical protein
MTREEWLNRMTEALRPHFEGVRLSLPALRVSCGWPSARGLASPTSKNRTIGQCWAPHCSADGTSELFISPVLADAADVAAVLVHELIHAAIGCDQGHGPQFRRAALAAGLTGKMTATTATPELAERLNVLAAQIGPYPHASLDRSQQKKQSTRLIKLRCPECGYTVRTTRQWIAAGLPTCPCGQEMQEQ